MKEIICSNCGYIGKPKRIAKGSTGVEIILWLCFLIPGLIYSFWRLSSYHAACPTCGSENLVPLDSPNGKKLVESQGKTLEAAKADAKQSQEVAAAATHKKQWIWAAVVAGVLLLIWATR